MGLDETRGFDNPAINGLMGAADGMSDLETPRIPVHNYN